MNLGNWIKGVTGAYWKIAAAFVLGALLTAPLAYCEGKSAGTSKADAAAAVATVEVMKVDADAKEVAAIERRKDDASIAEKQEALTDAVANIPDALPSPRRVALACERLRQQGTDTTALAACR
ncbi:hypothetical protein [Sphingobium chungbukense]|uniref:hypothetical protein n=1 Tax=Sphingobium chungbukense TaxID=56193 RepID=UPI0006997A0A|nr:hypothetical protein [Sphingobium chungbukense]